MDREIIYPGQIPLETHLLDTNRNTMVALAKFCQAVLGDGPIINGLDCTPTVPESLDVVIGPGEIYALAPVDATDYSSLVADTDHNIMKQGIVMDSTTLACTPPTTSGYSRKYLVQIGFSETDTGSMVLPYYNSANPSHGWSGPGNTGVAQYTSRDGLCIVQLNAGTAAPTGTETAPTADPGFTPAWIITVDHGDTEITSGNIERHPDAPIIPTKLPDIVTGGGGGTIDPATSTPLMDGTGSTGSQTKYARGDHRHPTDTTRAALADIPQAATTNPLMDGTVDVGSSIRYARANHRHPTDTSRASVASLSGYARLDGADFSGDVNVLDRPGGDSTNHAANTQFVSDAIAAATSTIVPVGTIWPGLWASAPTGWLECDGSAVSRTTYADLYALLGTRYGAGNGSTTFNLPNFAAGETLVSAAGNALADDLSSVGEVIAHTHNIGIIGSGASSPSPIPTVWPDAQEIVPGDLISLSTGGTKNLAAGLRVMFCIYPG